MSIHRTAAKRDISEPAIIAALKTVGASVSQLSGAGIPDLLVGFRGETYLLECKTGKGKLTDDEKWWHETWRGGIALIVRNADEALRAIGAIE